MARLTVKETQNVGRFINFAGISLFRPREESVRSTESITENAGSVIGRYKLLEKIGEGGMGVVYMAEQREPIVRRVALKIIKLGDRQRATP